MANPSTSPTTLTTSWYSDPTGSIKKPTAIPAINEQAIPIGNKRNVEAIETFKIQKTGMSISIWIQRLKMNFAVTREDK